MFRATLLCLAVTIVALVGETCGVDRREEESRLRIVVVKQPYVQNLEKVKLAAKLALDLLDDGKHPVTDPRFHLSLVLGQVDAAANDVWNVLIEPSEKAYVDSLNADLAKVYQTTELVKGKLLADLVDVALDLDPLEVLKNSSCDGLDNDDCNAVIEAKIKGNYALNKSARTLELAAKTANLYLSLDTDVQWAAKKLSGLGYLLNFDYRLVSLTNRLGRTLLSARSPLQKQ